MMYPAFLEHPMFSVPVTLRSHNVMDVNVGRFVQRREEWDGSDPFAAERTTLTPVAMRGETSIVRRVEIAEWDSG